MRVSRHFLADRLTAVQWLPRPPPALGDDGEVEARTDLPLAAAVGTRVGVLHLHVPHDERHDTQLTWIEAWEADAQITELRVWDEGHDASESTLVLATAQGDLATLQVDVHPSRGGPPVDGSDAARVVRLGAPHRGRVAKVDVHPTTFDLLSAGVDGRVCWWDRHEPARATTVVDGCVGLGFVDVRWSTRDTWITASVSGVAQVWDRRHSTRDPTCTLPMRSQPDGSRPSRLSPGRWEARCLHVDPSHPHLCYAGSQEGTVLVWDTRAPRAPRLMRTTDVADAGDVWCVVSDPTHPPACPRGWMPSSPAGDLWYCTEDGQVCRGGMDAPPTLVYQESASLVDMAWDPYVRQDPSLVVCSDQQTLVTLRGPGQTHPSIGTDPP